MTDNLDDLIEEVWDKSTENFQPNHDIVSGILTKYFKTLYEKAGIDWTEENDKDIDKLIDNLMQMIGWIGYATAGEQLLKYNYMLNNPSDDIKKGKEY